MVKAHTHTILACLCTQQILETPLPACVPVGIHSYFPAKLKKRVTLACNDLMVRFRN